MGPRLFDCRLTDAIKAARENDDECGDAEDAAAPRVEGAGLAVDFAADGRHRASC